MPHKPQTLFMFIVLGFFFFPQKTCSKVNHNYFTGQSHKSADWGHSKWCSLRDNQDLQGFLFISDKTKSNLFIGSPVKFP